MQLSQQQRTQQRQPPDERIALTEKLDWHRATVHTKCDGLSDAASHQRFLPSPLMTIAGLVSHLRWNEHAWFEVALLGRPDRGPWANNSHPDAEMFVDDVPLSRLLDDYRSQCDESRRIVASLELDTIEAAPPEGGEPCSLRWILLHLIEETARHNGHLDIMREFADGVTGE